MLDNEDSTKLQTFFRDEAKVEAHYVPPSTHRRNRSERAIRDWKAHFISGLDSVDKDFLMTKLSLLSTTFVITTLTLPFLHTKASTAKNLTFWPTLYTLPVPRSSCWTLSQLENLGRHMVFQVSILALLSCTTAAFVCSSLLLKDFAFQIHYHGTLQKFGSLVQAKKRSYFPQQKRSLMSFQQDPTLKIPRCHN